MTTRKLPCNAKPMILASLFAAALLVRGPHLLAQTTMDAHASESYASPAAALSAAAALDSGAPWTGVTVNAVHPVSVTMPGYTGGTYLTWMVDRSGFSADACTATSDDIPAPVYWTGTGSCGSGLRSLATHHEATQPLLFAWIAANLDGQQQETMVTHRATGVQASGFEYWVLFQQHQIFCAVQH